MNRWDFYRDSFRSLGVLSTINLQIQKLMSIPTVRLTSPQLQFPVYARNGTSDLYVFHQVFVDREYSCVDHLNLEGLIVDLGANVGYTSAYFLSRFPKCSVIAVEPDPDNYRCLVENLRPYGARCKTIKAAAWPHRESLTFSSASLRPMEEWGRQVERSDDGTIDTVSIPDLLVQGGCDQISLLKIDIEGAETELFSFGIDRWINKFDHIVIELHGVEATQIFNEAIRTRCFIRSRSGELTVCLKADAR